MARAKEFDEDAVLTQAVELFWERGYAATTTAELVERLGIGRASLYATFGSKRDLYLKALDHYSRTRDPVAMLSTPGPTLPAVRGLIDLYVEQCIADRERRGCMIANAAGETARTDADVTRLVSRDWQSIEVSLVSALTRAKAQGELGPDKDPRALAQFLLVLLQGLKVVGKGDPDPIRLRTAADQALTLLN